MLLLLQRFSALGDKTRYAIVEAMVRDSNWCVSEFAEKLQLTPAAISQHMKILEQAGIIRPLRQGRRVCYELDRKAAGVRELTEMIKKGGK